MLLHRRSNTSYRNNALAQLMDMPIDNRYVTHTRSVLGFHCSPTPARNCPKTGTDYPRLSGCQPTYGLRLNRTGLRLRHPLSVPTRCTRSPGATPVQRATSRTILGLPRTFDRGTCSHRPIGRQPWHRSPRHTSSMQALPPISSIKRQPQANLERLDWAVTTTAGRNSPASDPVGTPRSSSTTSPEVSIEPVGLCLFQGLGEVLAHLLLAQHSYCAGDGVRHGRLSLARQPFEFLVDGTVDADRRGLCHNRSLRKSRRSSLLKSGAFPLLGSSKPLVSPDTDC